MATRFENMTALVTGAARGIGFAISRQLVAEGAQVVMADVDGEAVAASARSLSGLAGGARAIQMDVTSRQAVTDAVEHASSQGALDLLVSNVGVALETPFPEVTDAQWMTQISATLTGSFLCTQIAAEKLMRSRHGGRAVLIGSVNGQAGFGHEAYSAAKAAVHNLTANLAVRYGPSGVRFNAVAPGTVITEAWEPRVARDQGLLNRMAQHYPLGTLGLPEDVVHAVCFLLSDEARWITGTVLTVDGGLTAGNVSLWSDRTVRSEDDR